MRGKNFRHNRRGGVLLDAVLSAAVVILGAFALETLGFSLHRILEGAARFFGVA
jgi:hypothetical protein